MNGWSSQRGDDRWGDEPAWVYEITWEWEPQSPGQRYPGDPGRRKAVHTPVYEASQPGSASVSGPGSGSASGAGSWSAGSRDERPYSSDDRTYSPDDRASSAGQRGYSPGERPAAQGRENPGYPQRGARDEPSWNRPAGMVPAPDQRRTADLGYGRQPSGAPGSPQRPQVT